MEFASAYMVRDVEDGRPSGDDASFLFFGAGRGPASAGGFWYVRGPSPLDLWSRINILSR
jgi:hypothetical protein